MGEKNSIPDGLYQGADVLLFLCPPVGHPYRFASLGLAYLVAVLKRARISSHSVNLSELLYRLDKSLYLWLDAATSWKRLYRRGTWGDDPSCLDDIFTGQGEKDSVLKLNSFADLAAERTLKASPALVGLSVMQSNAAFSLALGRRLKKAGKTVIVGGPAVNEPALARHFLKDACDCILQGEAEKTFPMIVKDFLAGKGLPPAGTIVQCSPPQRLDALPFPDFDTDKPMGWMPVTTSRGCIARCHFCEETRFFKKFRHRTVGNVVDEIEKNRERFSAKGIQFHDSLINYDREWLMAFCKALRHRVGKIEWQAFARPTGMDNELLEEIKRSGCSALFFGVEHFSQRISDRLGKRLDVGEASKVIERTAEHGIPVKIFLITGIPGEEEKDHQESVKAVARLRRRYRELIDVAAVNPLMITPHSLFMKTAEKFGVRLRRDEKGLVTECLFTNGPDRDTILRRRQELLALTPQPEGGHDEPPAAAYGR